LLPTPESGGQFFATVLASGQCGKSVNAANFVQNARVARTFGCQTPLERSFTHRHLFCHVKGSK